MTIEGNPTLPKTGIEDIPDEVTKYYPSELEAKKIKKPLVCYLLDVDKRDNKRATLVTKPIKVKYGSKWFNAGQQKYFINYSQIMNFGKHYAYLCQFGNSVGALSFHEYGEYVDANQVEMMVQQHSVEVFKKNKGISTKMAILLIIVAMIGVVSAMIAVQFAIGSNNAFINQKNINTNLTNENNELKTQLEQAGINING